MVDFFLFYFNLWMVCPVVELYNTISSLGRHLLFLLFLLFLKLIVCNSLKASA